LHNIPFIFLFKFSEILSYELVIKVHFDICLLFCIAFFVCSFRILINKQHYIVDKQTALHRYLFTSSVNLLEHLFRSVIYRNTNFIQYFIGTPSFFGNLSEHQLHLVIYRKKMFFIFLKLCSTSRNSIKSNSHKGLLVKID